MIGEEQMMYEDARSEKIRQYAILQSDMDNIANDLKQMEETKENFRKKLLRKQDDFD